MEFYFSDANLQKDRFLKQQVTQAVDGCEINSDHFCILTLSLPVTHICVNFSTLYNDTLVPVAKGLTMIHCLLNKSANVFFYFQRSNILELHDALTLTLPLKILFQIIISTN